MSVATLLLTLSLLFEPRHCKDDPYVGGSRIPVTVYANTLLENDGVSTVPPIFGLSANNGASDFSKEEGVRFLATHHVDTVGLGVTMNTILPQSSSDADVTALTKWFGEGSAKQCYMQTEDYSTLVSRGIRQAGARPFLFVRNVDGTCSPYCQAANCWDNGGTPKCSGSQGCFSWWAALINGYLSLALEADPDIDIVHIWNEPDSYFWKDQRNGSHYAHFYLTIARSIKSKWPNLKLGGPVTSQPPLTFYHTRKNSLLTWQEYIKPLIDMAVPQQLLDFVDFHAMGSNISPEVLSSAVETVHAYSLAEYGVHLPIAVTASNRMDSTLLSTMTSTMALLRAPDKVISKLHYDYQSTPTSGDFPSSPEAQLYHLLGRIANGSRLHVEVGRGNDIPNCQCSGDVTGQPLVAEAVSVGTNLTIVLLNTCKCQVSAKITMVGSANSAVAYSWAGVLQYDKVQQAKPFAWSTTSSKTVSLPAESLYLATYQFSTRYSGNSSIKTHNYGRAGKRFPVKLSNVRLTTTALPRKSAHIMMALSSCSNMFAVQYDATRAMDYKILQVLLRVGFIGTPGLLNWVVSWKCSQYHDSALSGSRTWLQMTSPGYYYEVMLPCIPRVKGNNAVQLYFRTSSCTEMSDDAANITLQGSSSQGYLAFTSLVYVAENVL